MSTRSVIARQAGDGFIGRYHHSDGYPIGVGAAIYRLYNGYFKQDAKRMLEVLVDEHPAGWSTIVGANLGEVADFSKRIGFHEQNHGTTTCPQCYCHGDRHEEENTITDQDVPFDIEYIYVINEQKNLMTIRDTVTDLFSVIHLDGKEPNWQFIGIALAGEEAGDE